MKLSIDAVVFTYSYKTLKVLLIKRSYEPYTEQYCFPGGFITDNETADEAVLRVLETETGSQIEYLEQLYTFTKPDRDPRDRIITIAYYGLVNSRNIKFKQTPHATEVDWIPYDRASKLNLGFDHNEILKYAYQRLQNKFKYEPIGFDLLPSKFTLQDIYVLYCEILGEHLDYRNLVRKFKKMGLLIDTNTRTDPPIGPKAKLFKFDVIKYNGLRLDGFMFDI